MLLDLKLGNDFLHVPRLPTDGKGFIVWKERLELSIWARGLYGHLDGTVTRPDAPLLRLAGSTALTTEQVSTFEKYAKDISQYSQEQAIVFQQMASTISDSLYLKIKGKLTVKEAWKVLKADFKRWSRMITIELWKKLQDTCCIENRNICTHFNNIRTLQEELASLGIILSELDFSAIVLGLLPKSYDQFLSAVTATASVLKQELSPEDLMQWSSMSMTNDPLDLEPRRRTLTPHFLLGATIEEVELERNLIKKSSVSIVTGWDTRRLTVGQKKAERKGRDLEWRQRKKNWRKRWLVL